MAAVRTRTTTEATRAGAERIIAACLPSITDMLFASILIGVLFGLRGRTLGYDGDAAWNLRIGSYVLDHGIPRTEFMLSTTLGQPTLYWEWLSQTAYAVALRLGGLNGVVTLAALLVALTSSVLFATMRQRNIPLALAMPLALVATGLTSITWTARAQLFSLLLTLLWSECIWRYWRSGERRLLWLFPAAMAVWVNLHGGFIAGIILLATTAAVAWLFPRQRARAQPRDLTVALGGTLAATLVNPWGVGLITHIFAFFRNPLITRYTQEYQSPNFHTLSMQIFLLLVFALAGAWIWMGRVPSANIGAEGPAVALEPLAVAHGAIWTALALGSVRFVPLWALIVTPLLGEAVTVCLRAWLQGTPERSRLSRRAHELARRLSNRFCQIEATDRLVGKGVWSALVLLWVVATVARGGVLPGTSAHVLDARFSPTVFPVEAAQRLHANGLPEGRGFTTFTWGGYLDYALPEYHVFIDSRSDVYSQQFLQDYADIMALSPNWQQRLDRYNVRWALLPTGEPLTQMLKMSPRWKCAAADSGGVAELCTRVAQ